VGESSCGRRQDRPGALRAGAHTPGPGVSSTLPRSLGVREHNTYLTGAADMRRVLSLGTLLLASVLAGCSEDGSGPIFCTEEYRAGITVEITDSATGLAAAEGATLTIREGEYVESWTDTFGGVTLAGAWERAGTYDVTVAKDGYHTWIHTGVVVDADECHVLPVAFTAALQRLEP